MSILSQSTDTAAAVGVNPAEQPRTVSQSPPKDIDLLSCTPDELASWLLSHRFRNNAVDVASFLLNGTSTLPNAEEISARLLGGGGGDCEDDDDEEENDDEAMEEDGNTIDEDVKAKPPAAAEAATKPSVDPHTRLLHSIIASRTHPTFANDDNDSNNNNEIEVSCTNPRGKFLVSVYQDGIVLANPKKKEEERIPISSKSVDHVLWFRKPEDYKKMKQIKNGGGGGKKKNNEVPGHMVLICLKEGAEDENESTTMFRNKPLKQVCFQVPSYPANVNDNDGNKQQRQKLTEEEWWKALNSALLSPKKKDGIIRVHTTTDGKSNGYVFQSEGESGSSSTTAGMPYVGAYMGFNDGALFPLREGLLFFKPPLFVPRSKLASISCGRGSGGSRYVDMHVQLDVAPVSKSEGGGGSTKKKKKEPCELEFTNIHRDELTGLNDYIHKTLIPAMQSDVDGSGDAALVAGSDEDESDEDIAVAEVVDTSDDENAHEEEDDDESDHCSEEEEGSSSSSGGSRKRRPSRAASKSAREITRAALKAAPADEEGEEDDSDDDSDALEEGSGSEESEDESIVSDDSDDSSEEGEEFEVEEVDDSDDEDDEDDVGRKTKKARR